jgi:hypothetical protein
MMQHALNQWRRWPTSQSTIKDGVPQVSILRPGIERTHRGHRSVPKNAHVLGWNSRIAPNRPAARQETHPGDSRPQPRPSRLLQRITASRRTMDVCDASTGKRQPAPARPVRHLPGPQSLPLAIRRGGSLRPTPYSLSAPPPPFPSGSLFSTPWSLVPFTHE